jgi:hypothetical protein
MRNPNLVFTENVPHVSDICCGIRSAIYIPTKLLYLNDYLFKIRKKSTNFCDFVLNRARPSSKIKNDTNHTFSPVKPKGCSNKHAVNRYGGFWTL